ncbi:MAG: hypothetical protein DRQ88_06080 [Epsilonproteobacteria bacterium]|nr:MAG: hypothetical protein DRQ88_06080 [Campylobacterota bacterium]
MKLIIATMLLLFMVGCGREEIESVDSTAYNGYTKYRQCAKFINQDSNENSYVDCVNAVAYFKLARRNESWSRKR